MHYLPVTPQVSACNKHQARSQKLSRKIFKCQHSQDHLTKRRVRLPHRTQSLFNYQQQQPLHQPTQHCSGSPRLPPLRAQPSTQSPPYSSSFIWSLWLQLQRHLSILYRPSSHCPESSEPRRSTISRSRSCHPSRNSRHMLRLRSLQQPRGALDATDVLHLQLCQRPTAHVDDAPVPLRVGKDVLDVDQDVREVLHYRRSREIVFGSGGEGSGVGNIGCWGGG